MLGESGYNVIIFDNLSAGKREAALGKPLIQDDILNADAIREKLRKYHISAVMQFAASLSVADSVIDPKGYYQNHNSRPDNNEILKEISEIATESIRKGERKEDVIEFQRLDIDQEYLYDILISLEANFSLGKKIFRGKKIIE